MKTIFKLAIALLALFSFAACSDVPMPYDEPGTSKNDSTNTETGTYLDETFETSFGKFTNVTVKGNAWVIDFKTAKATGYDNTSKSTTASEAYLVSAPVDLSKSTAAYLQFEYILRYVRAGQTENKVLITDNYTGNPSTTTWTDITGTLTEGSDWTTFSTYSKNIPTAFLGKSNVVVALMYSCTTTSSTIEIKNLVMKDGKVEESGDTPSTPDTPSTGEPKGTGTAADPYNAAGANKAAEGMKDGDKKENVYVSGIISKIKSVSTQFGNAEFYISDDGKTEGSQFYVFRALYLNGAKFTAEDQIKVGQKVVVKGSLVNYKGNTPELAQGGQIVSIEGSGTDTPDTPATGDITMKAGDFGVETTKEMGTQTLSDGTTLTFDKGSNNNAPKYYSTGSGTIRLYPGNTIAINAGSKKVASITIVCDSYQGTDYTAEGKLTSTQGTVSLSGLTYTISNINASTFTLTNGDTGTGQKTQLRALSITITYAK